VKLSSPKAVVAKFRFSSRHNYLATHLHSTEIPDLPNYILYNKDEMDASLMNKMYYQRRKINKKHIGKNAALAMI
jgi:hypothetical protein